MIMNIKFKEECFMAVAGNNIKLNELVSQSLYEKFTPGSGISYGVKINV